MGKEDREVLERMARAQEQIAGIMGKPENKIVKAMTVASLPASLLGAGLVGIGDFVIKNFFGG